MRPRRYRNALAHTGEGAAVPAGVQHPAGSAERAPTAALDDHHCAAPAVAAGHRRPAPGGKGSSEVTQRSVRERRQQERLRRHHQLRAGLPQRGRRQHGRQVATDPGPAERQPHPRGSPWSPVRGKPNMASPRAPAGQDERERRHHRGDGRDAPLDHGGTVSRNSTARGPGPIRATPHGRGTRGRSPHDVVTALEFIDCFCRAEYPRTVDPDVPTSAKGLMSALSPLSLPSRPLVEPARDAGLSRYSCCTTPPPKPVSRPAGVVVADDHHRGRSPTVPTLARGLRRRCPPG